MRGKVSASTAVVPTVPGPDVGDVSLLNEEAEDGRTYRTRLAVDDMPHRVLS